MGGVDDAAFDGNACSVVLLGGVGRLLGEVIGVGKGGCTVCESSWQPSMVEYLTHRLSGLRDLTRSQLGRTSKRSGPELRPLTPGG